MSELILRHRQRACPVNLPLFRRITRSLLTNLLGVRHYELGIHLVAAPEMTRLNKQYLDHEGSADVISFDYSNAGFRVPRSGFRLPRRPNPRTTRTPDPGTSLHGEIFICVDDAVAQARQFRTTWQSELVRYLAHGALHLRGYDDLRPDLRRAMKREENRLVRELSRLFPLSKLARKPTVRP